MKQRNHSGSLFLLEIILNILLFSVLLTICLQFIMKAHHLTKDTSDLHRAVTACTNVANLFEAGDGSCKNIADYYKYSKSTQNQVTIYFDKNFSECDSKEAVFTITISGKHAMSSLSFADIICMRGEQTLYELEASHLKQLTPESIKEVPDE